jgi:hypothetical protein
VCRVGFLAVFALWPLASAANASRLAVAPLRGKGGAECAKSLAKSFGERFEIIELEGSIEELSTWEQLSEWIARHGGSEADLILVGSLGKKSIILEAYSGEERKLLGLRSVATPARCQPSRRALGELIAWIARALGEPEPEPLADLGEPELEDPPAPPGELEAAAVETEETKVASPAPVLSTAASIAIGRRSLTFTGFEGSRVRSHAVDAMPVARLALDAFPIPRTGGFADILAPLGVGVTFAHSIAVGSALVEGGVEHPTVQTEVEAALLYRYQLPFESLNAVLIPRIGYHHVGVGFAGARTLDEPDVPNVSYSSVSFGIGAEAPVYERITVFGRGSYLLLLDAGQIFRDHFFPEGSGRGYEIVIGMSYRVIDALAVEIVGHHVSYALTLDPNGSPAVADSASDTISAIGIGASLSL